MIEGMPERDERPWEPCQMNRRELAMGRPCPRPAPLPWLWEPARNPAGLTPHLHGNSAYE